MVGYDHKFGKNREGGFDYLQKCAEKFNFEIERLDALLVQEDSVSSTKIRDALQKVKLKKQITIWAIILLYTEQW